MPRARPLSLSLARALALVAALPAVAGAQGADGRADPAAASRPACDAGRAVRVDGITTPAPDLLRTAQLAGAAPLGPDLIRRGGARTETLCADGDRFAWTARLPDDATPPSGALRVDPVPLRLETVFASRYPEPGNDGLLWAGRGFSTLVSGGVRLRYGALSAALAPEVAWQQNAYFDTVPTGRTGDLAFENPWYGPRYDVPQRFGSGPFTRASLGQSYLRVDAFGVALGVSTENLWLGPGIRSAIVLTNAGPGFPHAFVGTSSPVDIGIGRLEALALWGAVDRSRYDRNRQSEAFTALAVDWEPRWVPGLYLGAVRAFIETTRSLREDAYLTVLQPPWKSALPSGDNPQDNQLAALWFRWVFPESHLELYGEWGKDDFPASLGALLRETEKRDAWVLGLQKLGQVRGRWVRLQLELASTYDGGGGLEYDPFYVHYSGRLGWTNGGQPLGMFAGPGGIVSTVALDVLGARGRFGVFFERLERNTDVFIRDVAPQPRRGTDRDTEVAAGLRQVLVTGPVELSWEAAGTYRWNRDFLRNEGGARVAVSLALPAGRAAAGAP